MQTLLRELIDMEETLSLVNRKKEQLYIRYASIISDIPLFELNIPIDLLDDSTYKKVEPYFHNLSSLVEENNLTLGEKMELEMSKQKYVLQSDLTIVSDLLGIDGITDSTYYRTIFTKLIDLHTNILEIISHYHLDDGKRSEFYFGEKFYPKLQGTKYAFSIDDKSENTYLLNYGVDDDIPIIFEADYKRIIAEAIRLISISQDDLDFYTTY